MSTTRPGTTPVRAVDALHDPADAHRSSRLVRSAPAALLSAAGLLALMGALLITEDLTGITLFPAAMIALAFAGIALGGGLAGVALRLRRHRLGGGRTALISSSVAAAGGTLLVVMVPVGLATGGLSGDAPVAVDRLAAIAILALWVGTFVGATATGIGVWRSAVPSRAIGVTLTGAGLLFLVPVSIEVAIVGRPPVAVIVALFSTWMVLFGGTGIALRR